MNEHDEDLRELFQDATSDIRPQGTYDDILDRTKKVDPMTRRWFLPVTAAATVIGLAIGGAVLISHDSSNPKGTRGPLSSTTPTPNPSTGTALPLPVKDVTIFYLGDTPSGPRLFSEVEPVEAAEGTGAPSYGLNAVIRMQRNSPEDPDYRGVWPTSAKIDGLGSGFGDSPDTITIYFASTSAAERPAGMTAAEARLSIEQLVRTAQSGAGSRAPVTFQLEQHNADGTSSADDQHPLKTLLGVPVDGLVRPAPDDEVLAPVQISSPANGANVPAGRLTVTGTAATFEANVVWELKTGGTVVQHGHATAAECCTLSPYEFTINNLEPGSYTLVVHDEDMSGNGRPVNQDTKEIVAQ